MPDTESPVPVINLKDGTRLAGDDAPKRKDLEKWLKEHPGYVEDLGAFIPVGDALQILVLILFLWLTKSVLMKHKFLPTYVNTCSAQDVGKLTEKNTIFPISAFFHFSILCLIVKITSNIQSTM